VEPSLAPASSQELPSGGQPQEAAGSAVVWSAWSQWSSCVDKNGFCDPQRLHSRLRKCVDQRTGEKVDAGQCRQRFNMQDQELEVSDCAAQCAGSPSSSSSSSLGGAPSQSSLADPSLMSDAPQGPQTAPSVMLAGVGSAPTPTGQEPAGQAALSSFLLPAALGGQSPASSGRALPAPLPLPLPLPPAGQSSSLGGSSSAQAAGDKKRLLLDHLEHLGSTERVLVQQQQQTAANSLSLAESSSPLPQMQPPASLQPNGDQAQQQQQQQQAQMSCSNCTSDEICLLLVEQKVPFCAKVKDRQDESGCGGWCEQTSGQLCQPLGGGSNAFKCIHDSECLADEWRCHNSACIPLSKRCDGHSNCYDNSDERDCPAI